jgi:hypothetical protein
MTQTASALSTRQSLHISTDSTLTINTNTREKHQLGDASLSNDTFYPQSPAFYYNERLRLGFIVNEKYAAHFILIKGLIEFHRSGNFKFAYNIKEKSFEVDILSSELEKLNSFLEKIRQWLNQEIKFKAALKNVIAFENRYKAARDHIYGLQQVALSAI